ncbi:MAG: methyltransferase, partial [Polyangia bacterium]
DLGAGAGHYAAAFLDALPAARATLVDRKEVLALAAPRARQRLVAGDLFHVELEPHGIALLANVAHLYDAADGARLCARAAALAELVVVKDLWIEPDRSGPPASLYFALNMALFTDGGEVHPAARIAGWLGAAGLREPQIERLGDDVIVWARR